MTDLPPERPLIDDDDIEWEVVEHDPALTNRSVARRAALQALYEVDAASHEMNVVIAHRLEHKPLPNKEANYMRRLVNGAVKHQAALDAFISRFAPEWPLDQVAIVDRNILRLATYEILFRDDTPPKVAIDEAIELAKRFGTADSPRFVNGILDRIAAAKTASVETLSAEP